VACGLVLAGSALVAGCGVEVPDDVAEATSTTTEPPESTTTAPPTSDDELEQVLLDNGFSLEEARCGAANLREELSASEVQEILRVDDVEDIRESTSIAFSAALDPCLDGGG
jgi:hypothetical protein